MVEVSEKPRAEDAVVSGDGRWRHNGIIPFLPEEVDFYGTKMQGFQAGQEDPLEFRAFRLRHGVYGQRQPGVQMFRVKIPLGRLTPEQLEVLGRIARDYTPLKRGHITTRENVQFHFLDMGDTPELMRMLGESGLTTKEACGNTVRNVTTCPLAGVCPEEVFDPTPYAVAYIRFFVRHETTQNMPRKWKTAFSGCAHNWAITDMHDLALEAVVRQEDGKERKGFRIKVGGGTSIQPLMAQTLYEFVPVEEFLRVIEACLRVYNAADELRVNRMKARVKVLVNKIGIAGFRARVEKELQDDWAKGDYDPTPWMEPPETVVPPPVREFASCPKDDAAFDVWRATNVIAQKQPGFVAAFVKTQVGNVTDAQLFGLAELARKYASGASTSQRQNLVLTWVRPEALYSLYQELKALDLSDSGANEISDVVSCPGTESCSLGITSSMLMGTHLWEHLRELKLQDPLVRAMRINVSGCPDGCGQHHVANIGFQGAAMKVGSAQLPAYEVYLAGSQVHPVRYGTRLKVKVPSKRVDEAIQAITGYYVQHRGDGEPFNAFFDRVGTAPFEELLRPVAEVPPLGRETINYYIDWGKTVLYKVERGEGECAI